MSRISPHEGLRPTILDRLVDPESAGTATRRGYSVDQMIDAVRADLEDLLNSRRMVAEIPEELAEVRRSVVAYGVPDLSAFEAAGPNTASLVCAEIEQAIAAFEPRLSNVRVVPLKGDASKSLRLDFEIRATLRLDPSPEVAFVTLLKLTTGEASVERAGG